MKNIAMKLLLGLLAAGALCMASCTDEEFVREAGGLPTDTTLDGTAAQIVRMDCVDGTLRMLDADIEDRLLCRLSRPATHAMALKVEVDPNAVETYNKEHETAYPLFPTGQVTLLYQTTIPEGAGESDPVRVLFERADVEAGVYLLPLKAAIDDQAVRQDDAAMRFCYVVQVYEDKEPGVLDKWPFLTVGYINTEQMSPLYADGFFFIKETKLSPPISRTEKTWLDLVPLRTSRITLDDAGRVSLELGPDLQYVFHNREKYIVPIQRGGRKVLLCIHGCLRALDDAQVADAAYRIGKVVEEFRIDGINFFDMGDSYDKPGAPAIIPSSYAKLIKATKETLGERLVTVACDAPSTEELAVEQDGVKAGQYIDYAWSGIFDKAVDAYSEGAELRPIAGLQRTRYGGCFLQTHSDALQSELSWELGDAIKDLYFNHTESANVFAFWDLPTNQQGTEAGPLSLFNIMLSSIKDTSKRITYSANCLGWWGNYGTYTKDW